MGKYETVHNLQFHLILWFNTNHRDQLQSSHQITQIPIYYIIYCLQAWSCYENSTPGTPVFSTNKTDCHDITEILLKVVLSTINQKYYYLH
jgi:hypothetical protein